MTEIETTEGAARGLDRRTIIKGAAWSVPVVAAAVASPLAASTPAGQGLLDIDAGCIQVAGVNLFPGYSVNNVGNATYNDGTITIVETIDLSNIALDPQIGAPWFNNGGALSAAARASLWTVLLVEGIASGSSAGVTAGSWTILQNGPSRPWPLPGNYAPFSYQRVLTINVPIAAGGREYWGNLFDVAAILNILEGLGIGAELVQRNARITAPTGNPPVVDAGPSTLSWNLIGGC